MAAIITENYRKALAKLLQNETDRYYVGLGKSDEWYEDLSGGLTSPFPQGTSGDSFNVLNSLTDLIRVNSSDYAIVIPNVPINDTPSYYKRFNPYDASCLYPSTIGDIVYKPAYFIEPSSGNVFLVLDAPSNVTLSVTDDTNGYFQNGNTGDASIEIANVKGYTIVYIGTSNPNSKFNNSQFVEVTSQISEEPDDYDSQGVVYGFHVANGGLYETSESIPVATATLTATVKVYQHGANENDEDASLNIQGTCSVVDGKITLFTPSPSYYVNLANRDPNLINFKFTKAISEFDEIVIGSGIIERSRATVYPCISNINGFKYDMSQYTPSWHICFLVNSDVSVQDIYTNYSQISLIRNPKLVNDEGVLNVNSKNMKRSFTLASYTAPTIDSTYAIVQKNNDGDVIKRIGVVDSYEQSGTLGEDAVIYYTSSAKYGYDTPFTAGAGSYPISFIDTSDGTLTDTSVVPSALTNPIIDTADVFFIDNRGKIDRADDQNEELKIIIQL
jgi:hypothetical protein